MNSIILFLLVCPLFHCLHIHMGFGFGNRVTIKQREYKKQISYKLTPKNQKVVNKINGFYGLIGPDVNVSSVNNLFDLFIGDGNIQGVFFDRGNITLVKHFVRTDKLKYEEKHGQIPNNIFIKFLFVALNKINLLPNIMGLANTALFHVRNKIYALYERDLPYLLHLNFTTKDINTIKKCAISGVDHISGHSKFINNTIETIDYNVLRNHLIYYRFSHQWKSMYSQIIKTKYMPVIHDFWSGKNIVLFVDSPLVLDYKNIFKRHLPFLMKSHPTFIHVLHKNNTYNEIYKCNESFYIFHYGNVIETPQKIHIYASVYENLDFSDLNICGIYSEIVIDKWSKKVSVVKNPIFEKYNLDFPIQYGNKTIYRNVHNRTINGFVIVEKMKLIKELIFENTFIYGEPALVVVDKISYLIAFATINARDCILFINLADYSHFNIHAPLTFHLGFHSLFISGPNDK